jgi:hypothetical protein
MAPDGSFAGRVDGTSGLYLRAEDIDMTERLEPSPPLHRPALEPTEPDRAQEHFAPAQGSTPRRRPDPRRTASGATPPDAA